MFSMISKSFIYFLHLLVFLFMKLYVIEFVKFSQNFLY